METQEITIRSKNKEIRAAFPEQVKSGNVFVFAKGEPKASEKDGKVYVQLYMAQLRKDIAGGATDSQEFFLGWGGGRIVRGSQNTLQEVKEYEIGEEIPDFIITSKEVVGKPVWDKQKPVLYRGEQKTISGQPIYEHNEVLSKREFDQRNTRYDHYTMNVETAVTAEQRKHWAEQAMKAATDFRFNLDDCQLIPYDTDFSLVEDQESDDLAA